jgi:SAM-dependent methyltransferase
MKRFAEALGVRADMRVLDVGGTADIWALAPVRPRVVFLNQPRASREVDGTTDLVFGDGCRLPFADGAFDIAFSNSVIEHVGDRQKQAAFAAEMRRVGKQVWVQTPDRRFPIEQHLHTPIVHWLPLRWRAAVVNRFTVWAWLTRPPEDEREWYVRHFLESVHLLSAGELQELFPDAEIRRERFMGMSKSLVAVRRFQSARPH